ncbi:hypothetical protein J3F84DRAFT_382454 [Trichoderma pleuroticola]
MAVSWALAHLGSIMAFYTHCFPSDTMRLSHAHRSWFASYWILPAAISNYPVSIQKYLAATRYFRDSRTRVRSYAFVCLLTSIVRMHAGRVLYLIFRGSQRQYKVQGTSSPEPDFCLVFQIRPNSSR